MFLYNSIYIEVNVPLEPTEYTPLYAPSPATIKLVISKLTSSTVSTLSQALFKKLYTIIELGFPL